MERVLGGDGVTRVAYVCADPAVPVFGSGGCSLQVQGVVAALRHAGCSVHLFAARRGGEPPEALRGVPVEDLRGADLSRALADHGPFDLVYEHVESHGVDPSRFPAGLRPSRPAPPGIFTFGFVGSLEPWQDYAVLAEALRLMREIRPGFRLLVVGDGPARAGLESALAARRVADLVEMAGAVPAAAVPGLLASMDVAVAPVSPQGSLSFSPLTLYEYMAAGLPVVASRIAAIEETIQDGVNGILCPPGEAAAFAAALLDLTDKPSLRHALGRAARRDALARHTWGRAAERILDLARPGPGTPRVLPEGPRSAGRERAAAAPEPSPT